MSTLTCASATPATSTPEHDAAAHLADVPPRAVPVTQPTSGPDTEAPAEVTDPSQHPVEDAGDDTNPGVSELACLDRDDPDLGASTAEYAVIVLAAAAFGGVMAAVLSSDSVSGMLLGIIQKALAI